MRKRRISRKDFTLENVLRGAIKDNLNLYTWFRARFCFDDIKRFGADVQSHNLNHVSDIREASKNNPVLKRLFDLEYKIEIPYKPLMKDLRMFLISRDKDTVNKLEKVLEDPYFSVLADANEGMSTFYKYGNLYESLDPEGYKGIIAQCHDGFVGVPFLDDDGSNTVVKLILFCFLDTDYFENPMKSGRLGRVLAHEQIHVFRNIFIATKSLNHVYRGDAKLLSGKFSIDHFSIYDELLCYLFQSHSMDEDVLKDILSLVLKPNKLAKYLRRHAKEVLSGTSWIGSCYGALLPNIRKDIIRRGHRIPKRKK